MWTDPKNSSDLRTVFCCMNSRLLCLSLPFCLLVPLRELIASSVSLGLFEMHFSARGVLNEVVYEEATLRGPTPNLPFYVQL